MRGRPPLRLAGKIFGWLTVLQRCGSSSEGALWKCRCQCGAVITVLGKRLQSSARTSCGCHKGTANITHGHSVNGRPSPEYRAWVNMKERCLRKTNERYKDYGGRGIKICERWMKFENFFADIGTRPKGLSLERKNNDGNYEPGNCCWATYSEQMKNRRITDVFIRARSARKKTSKLKASGLPKGVSFVKGWGKYVACVMILGSGIGGVKSKKKYLGSFVTANQAGAAVRRAECAKL